MRGPVSETVQSPGSSRADVTVNAPAWSATALDARASPLGGVKVTT